MHFSLYIFLIGAVHSAVELHQKILMTKPATKLVRIECTFSSECAYFIHWYQKRDNEPLKRVQYVKISDESFSNEPGFDSFKSEKIGSNQFLLRIPNLKAEHSATYYCSCWSTDWIKIFGTGTRLYVTESETEKDRVKKPTVTAYPVSRPQSDGKRVLLCQAQNMFPNLVRFRWEVELQPGSTKKLPENDDDVLEQNDEDQEVRQTSMLIINEKKMKNNYKYSCIVEHDISVSDQKVTIPREQSEVVSVCPTPKQEREITEEINEDENKVEEEDKKTDTVAIGQKLYLFSITYVILLGKNVLYLCTVSVLLYKR